MESIHQQIEAEYRHIREQNERERKRRIALVYAKYPRIRELEEETYRAYSSLAANLFGKTPLAEQDNQKITQLQQEKKKLLRQAGYEDTYLDTIYTCPDCQDTGYIRTKPCHCYHDKKRYYLYQAANLTPVMQQQSFDQFSLKYYSKEILPGGASAYDYMESNLGICKEFVSKGEYQQGKNLFLYGSPGLGKTFLCSCIAQSLLQREVPVLYQTAYRLFSVLEDARFKKDETSEALSKQFYDIPVLMIDDLGTEFVTSYTSAVLFDLINARVQNKKSTVISTNLDLAQIKEQYSDRVQSRIFGDFQILQFFGNDIRKQKIINEPTAADPNSSFF